MSQTTHGEWDFMGRTFLVLAIANHGYGGKEFDLRLIDLIIDDTIAEYDKYGQTHYLMDYVKAHPFVYHTGHSVFFDGELALMLEARLRIAERRDYRERAVSLLHDIALQMWASPVLSAESYPNECWTFCNSVALAAMKMQGGYQELIDMWLVRAKTHLIDPHTGLLVSSFTVDGKHLDGPEGSSIWSVASFLSVIDPEFASDQYRLAKKELAGNLLGFGYSSEWPKSWEGTPDVDSGPVLFGVGAGASGQALVAAMTFGDRVYAQSLIDSAWLIGDPVSAGPRGIRMRASNQVGDAMVLYALSLRRELR